MQHVIWLLVFVTFELNQKKRVFQSKARSNVHIIPFLYTTLYVYNWANLLLLYEN
jgi:hypothetical protein